ncbi:hypothetical protein [Flyfo podovirus Tbat2_2]|nr:hypothetical protein [Flyfo podovirus Tbat2_2]
MKFKYPEKYNFNYFFSVVNVLQFKSLILKDVADIYVSLQIKNIA